MSVTNKKILFITFYGFRDYINVIKDGFENKGYIVEDVPYFMMKNDHNKTDADIINLIANKVQESYNNISIDSIFMFLLPENTKFIDTLLSKINCNKTKILFYNFDDPISTNADLIQYSQGINIFLTPNIHTIYRIRSIINCDSIVHLPLYYTLDDVVKTEEYKNEKTLNTDICILYDNNIKKYIDYDNIIKEIKYMAIEKDMTLKLLGPMELEDIYSDIYEGVIDIQTINDEVKSTKVVLHLRSNIYSNDTTDKVLIELMLGGNIIVVPYAKKIEYILKSDFNCIVLNNINDAPKLLQNITQNYEKYRFLEKNSHEYIKKNLSLSKWVDQIIHHIRK